MRKFKMTWINTEDTIAFGNRAAIASISVRDFVYHSGRTSQQIVDTDYPPEWTQGS
jgi:hypothetical protein